MRLILVRHGETEENVKKISQGTLPGNLTSKGLEQASKVGLRLKNKKIDQIYVSDLKRTVDTYDKIKYSLPNVPVLFVPELREFCRGVFNGRPGEDAYQHFLKQDVDYWDYVWEEGESLGQAQERIVKFFHKLLEMHKKDTVMLVTHGAIIGSLLLYLLNKRSKEDYLEYHPKNSAVTVLNIKDEKNFEIEILNCQKHLED